MGTKKKIALVAVPLAILSFSLSFVIWPNPVGVAVPGAHLVPYFMIVSAFESVAFGVGVALLIFGWPLLQRLGATGHLAAAAFVSAVWSLISWWPHDNMHRVNGMDNFNGLLRIEYMFHVTLIVAGFIVAAYLWRLMSQEKS